MESTPSESIAPNAVPNAQNPVLPADLPAEALDTKLREQPPQPNGKNGRNGKNGNGELRSEFDSDIFEFVFTRALDFRQETIYFLVVDRFFDGNSGNNLGPNPALYDPSLQEWRSYWGGDLEGVIKKLDYLRKLGVTALWLSPLFEQIETFAYGKSAPIHGYWPSDFKRINPRFLREGENPSLFQAERTVFDDLISELHRRDMKLILDIVCNHSNPDAGGVKGRLYDDGKLIADFTNDHNGWYHHYGEITDWEDDWQVQNCELCGLATFNENNWHYRKYIKDAIKLWLDRGVDALRIDTVKHMPLWFWQEFVGDIQMHKPDIFVFGEWGFSHPDKPASVEFSNSTNMSLLDFGLCEAIRQTLALMHDRGFCLVDEILQKDHLYDRATELVTFIDNHDMNRFMTLQPDQDMTRLAVILLMTLRGIPCLYYGTEQYLHNDTNAEHDVFTNNDPYNRPMMESWDESTPLFRVIRILSQLRRRNPAVSLGAHATRHQSPEAYCFERRYRDSRCWVALNRGSECTIRRVPADLPNGEYKCILSGRTLQIENGHVHRLRLAHKEAIVLSLRGAPVKGQTVIRVRLNGLNTQPGEVVVVTGSCPELGEWDINRAYGLEYINANTWIGEIPFNESVGKPIRYKYVLKRLNEHGQEVGAPIRENLPTRRWVVADEGIMSWNDRWCCR